MKNINKAIYILKTNKIFYWSYINNNMYNTLFIYKSIGFYYLFLHNNINFNKIGIVLDCHKTISFKKTNEVYKQKTCNQSNGIYYDFKLFYEAYKWLINL